ncbi:MAG: alpha/beta hydrolase-fold protein [Bacteroidetes bacterium]|nr:alpha/beta hydrolase-fold protein [Bacteroidota bacterium]MDA1121848.1 alpha/beta hydrolase-fold protein [Bacteroidota bacterium]
MYSTSITIGDWETFITRELVDYLDTNYQTIPNRNSRGLAGHSMGGYGTMRLGMKYPEVYSSIYVLSACCREGQVTTDPENMENIEAIASVEQLEEAPFRIMAQLASAASWAPNPNNPPLYLDLPFVNGEVRPDIASKIAANRTLYAIEQYIPNLRKLNAIAMDAGILDTRIHASTKKLHELLELYKIAHFYESYDGDHGNRIPERIQTKTLPFFSKNLAFK